MFCFERVLKSNNVTDINITASHILSRSLEYLFPAEGVLRMENGDIP